jgi:LacI family transcriptional regulator
MVFVDVGPDRPLVSNICIDYLHGIRQAVQHLAALRHRQIAFISGPMSLKSAKARRRAFEQSMSEIGLEVRKEWVREGDHTVEGGMKAADLLLGVSDRPTAVLCSNDITALGVLRQCYQKGLSVPRDLSVVGFDDIKLAEFVIPPLTTVRMSQAELARLAFHALLSSVSGKTEPAHGVYTLTTSLVLRDSTALAPVEAKTKKRHG